jgi:hypothetical protein
MTFLRQSPISFSFSTTCRSSLAFQQKHLILGDLAITVALAGWPVMNEISPTKEPSLLKKKKRKRKKNRR